MWRARTSLLAVCVSRCHAYTFPTEDSVAKKQALECFDSCQVFRGCAQVLMYSKYSDQAGFVLRSGRSPSSACCSNDGSYSAFTFCVCVCVCVSAYVCRCMCVFSDRGLLLLCYGAMRAPLLI